MLWNCSMDVITSRVEYRSSVFIKTVFEATFSFSNMLQITQATWNQIDNIKSFTSDMRFDVVGLTCRLRLRQNLFLRSNILRTDALSNKPKTQTETCSSLLDCNVFNLIYFDQSRSFWIRRWARLIVDGLCSCFFLP